MCNFLGLVAVKCFEKQRSWIPCEKKRQFYNIYVFSISFFKSIEPKISLIFKLIYVNFLILILLYSENPVNKNIFSLLKYKYKEGFLLCFYNNVENSHWAQRTPATKQKSIHPHHTRRHHIKSFKRNTFSLRLRKIKFSVDNILKRSVERQKTLEMY